MSGLPALRCFILFTADLIILVIILRSSPGTDRSGIHTYIPAWNSLECVKFVVGPGIFPRFGRICKTLNKSRTPGIRPASGKGTTTRYHMAVVIQPPDVRFRCPTHEQSW